MNLRDHMKTIGKSLKKATIYGSGIAIITYHIIQTRNSIRKIVNPSVLEQEKKHTAEYIYIDDPSYLRTLKLEQDKADRRSVGLARIWKSLQHSLAWRLLWLCRHGNKEQCNIALGQLAAFRNTKDWDCLKLAQALDKNTAVLLARTKGADLRYFLPAPIHVRRAALTSQLLSYKFRDMICAIEKVNPHSCIKHFLYKNFTSVQDQELEADSVPTKPNSISERNLCLLCLDAIHHHLSLFNTKEYQEDKSAKLLLSMDLFPILAELLLRYPNDTDIDMASLRILTVLSVYRELLTDFFQNGFIGQFARLLKSKDVRLSSSAAVSLANLSGEDCYRPGLYLLHPLYRTTQPHTCEILLVHGLRGGVFVTWRQRERKSAEPIGITEVTVSDVDCDPHEEKTEMSQYLDPELKQVIEDFNELEDLALLSEFEVVLHDLPMEAKREFLNSTYTSKNKRLALINEEFDHCNYTFCWPKDWLPKDCENLRILGVNYWSSLSEWLERCPLQTAEIKTRASDLAPALIDAGVCKKDIPVVWLAHSMGGLIVKQLLVDAAQSEDHTFKKICEETKAVLFYSTPHKGSALAAMPRAAAVILWPSNDVRQLQENSPILLELHQKFLMFADHYRWETISFAEMMPTLITAFKVPVHFVEASSADLGRGVFYKMPLDHLNICKPATKESMLYTTVIDVVERVTQNDMKLSYSSPTVNFFIDLVWWLYRRNKQDSGVVESIEDHRVNDSLWWFEQLLLECFTEFKILCMLIWN